MPRSKERPHPSFKEEINTAIGTFRCKLAKDCAVTIQLLYNTAIESFGLSKVGDIEFFGWYSEVKSVSSNLRWVNLHVNAFSLQNSSFTFHDLQKYLLQNWNSQSTQSGIQNGKHQEIESFDDLKLGPLQKQRSVRDIFWFDENQEEILKLSQEDIFWSLFGYYKESKSNRHSVDCEPFVEFLIKKFKVKDKHQLGIKIGNMKLLKKCHSEGIFHQQTRVNKNTRKLKEHLQSTVDTSFEEVMANLSNGEDYRLNFCQMSISDGLQKMLFTLKPISDRYSDNPTYVKLKDITSMLETISKDKLTETIFHYVVAVGALKQSGFNDERIQDILGIKPVAKEKEQASVDKKHAARKGKVQKNKTVPWKDILNKVVEIFNKLDTSVNLSSLKNVEKEVTTSWGVDHFQDLGNHGSFLEFLDGSKSLHKYLPGLVNLDPILVGNKGMLNNIPLLVAMDFLQQCDSSMTKENLETAFCTHFILESFQEANLGSLESILPKLDSRRNNQRTSCLSFHGTIMSNKHLNETTNSSTLTLDLSIIDILLAVPYLQEIYSWTSWKTIHQSTVGNLRDVLMTHSAQLLRNGFQAYEDYPGKIFRIAVPTDSMMANFKAAVESKDVLGTVLHLTSLLCNTYRTVDLAPLEHLGTYIDGADYEFVLDCIMKMPLRICCEVVEKVFLQPLMSGKHTLSKVCKNLLEVCKNAEQKQRLHLLGIIGGFVDWKEHHENSLQSAKMTTNSQTSNNQHEEKLTHLLENGHVENAAKACPTALSNEDIKDHGNDVQMQQSLDEILTGWSPMQQTDEENESQDDPKKKKTVDDIIRKLLGSGNHTGEDKASWDALHEMFGNSLKKLSTEIYSKDSHFLLELIQNADDNTYLTGEKPAIAFVLDEKSLTIYNNEIGFTDENVKALCNVGDSPKKHKQGYIGHKGIGFKSVFNITDTPEIHSAGFHFKLNAHSKVPYILPEWVKERQSNNRYSPPGVTNDVCWTTKIVLPLDRQDMTAGDITEMVAKLKPSLLMFLNRLQMIIVDDKISGRSHIMRCTKTENNILKLQNNNLKEEWFVVTKKMDMQAKKQNISQTAVSIAIPLSTNEGELSKSSQDVYAFLPVQSYGLKFIVQADFDVTSSRDTIVCSSHWNQEIIAKLPHIFTEAFEAAKNMPDVFSLKNASLLFDCIPTNAAMEPFQSVANGIISILKETNCIPVQSGVVIQDAPNWVKPRHALQGTSQIQQLIPQQELQKHLDLHYLDKVASSQIGQSLLRVLDVQSISLKQLIEIGKNLINHRWQTDKSPEKRKKTIEWIGRWLVSIYNSCHIYGKSEANELDLLKTLPVFPISMKQLIPLKGRSVFFPLKDENQSRGIFKQLMGELNVLHPSLFKLSESVACKELEDTLQHLGVLKTTADAIIHSHILPKYTTDEYQTIPLELSVEYVTYISQQMEQNEVVCNKEELESLYLYTNRGLKRPCEDSVYFGKCYKTPFDLAAMFPTVSWSFVSDAYLPEQKRIENLKDVVEFCEQLGVSANLCIRKKSVIATKEELLDMEWKDAAIWKPTSDGKYSFEDIVCEELSQLLQSGSNTELLLVAELLDNIGFDEMCSFGLSADEHVDVYDSEGNQILTTYSTLWRELKSFNCWMVAEDGVKYQPANIYLKSNDLYNLLGENVPYFSQDLKNKDFVSFLGVKTSIRWRPLMKIVITWSQDEFFTTDVLHMVNIYTFFNKHATKEELYPFFQEHPLIYVGNTQKNCFVGCNSACWETQSSTIDQHLFNEFNCELTILSEMSYPSDLNHFFTEKFGVSLLPVISQYTNILTAMAKCVNWDDTVSVQRLLKLQAAIGEQCVNIPVHDMCWQMRDEELEANKIETLWDEVYNVLLGLDVIPSTKKTLLKPGQALLFNDNSTEMERFVNEDGVNFVECLNVFIEEDEYQSRSKEAFITDRKEVVRMRNGLRVFQMICGVQRLTKCLDPSIVTSMTDQGCSVWHQFIHLALPFIQRYMYHKRHRKYVAFCNGQMPKMLKSASFFTVHKLEVAHYLKYVGKCGKQLLNHVSVLEKKHFHFEIEEESLSLQLQFSKESTEGSCEPSFAKLFAQNNPDLEQSLEEMLLTWYQSSLDVDQLEQYMKRKLCGPLPEGEENWAVPIPKYALPCKLPDNITIEKEESTAKENVVDNREKTNGMSCYPPPKPNMFSAPGKKSEEAIKNDELCRKIAEDFKFSNEDRLSTFSTSPQPVFASISPTSATLCDPFSTAAAGASHDGSNRPRDSLSYGDYKQPQMMRQYTQDKAGYELEFSTEDIQINQRRIELLKDVKIVDLNEAYTVVDTNQSHALESAVILLLEANDTSDKTKIGQAGEALIYDMLVDLHKDDPHINVLWLNKEQEMFKPYDLQITQKINEQTRVIYIEVKTTKSNDKELFEMSYGEIEFAHRKAECYMLYRVCGFAEGQAPVVKKLVNLKTYLDDKIVTTYLKL